MRVLVTTDAGFGGAERVVFALARGTARRDVPVHVIMLAGRGALHERLLAAGIACTALEARRPGVVPRAALECRLAALRPTLVHAHLHHANRLTQRARLPDDVARITTEHAVDPRFLPHRRWLERRLHGRSWAVVCVSRTVAAAYAGRVGVAPESLHVISPAVEPPLTPTRRDGPPRVLGFLGRLEREKGIDLLLRAFPGGPPAGVTFAIAGQGRWSGRVEGWARRAGERVQRHGFVADVDRFLGEIDALIVPSRTEGFGLAAAEALARGVPTLLADLPALRELAPGTAAFDPFFPPTPDGLRRAVEGWTAHASAARSWARERGAALRRELDLETMLARYEELYARVSSLRGR